jgi:hypothetical protein
MIIGMKLRERVNDLLRQIDLWVWAYLFSYVMVLIGVVMVILFV